ncbi:Proteasome maturation factor Ump1 [Cryptosporidium tyzzeri]|nr:Proteasome maturation factor Ump1 [Cryptosporidium tyzzeri]
MEKRFDLRYCEKFPNDSLLNGFAPRDLENELNMLSAIQGYHSAAKSRMEQDLVSKVQRHPGIPSSHLSLDLLMNMDDKIEISDILGTEKPINPLGKKTISDTLESIFNINS